MDFSKYGVPSQEWLAFVEANPSAALDGFQGNNAADAATLRAISNKARGDLGAALIGSAGLDQRVAITTHQIPSSKGSHSIPLRIYSPRSSNGDAPKTAVLYFHGGGFLFGDETTDDFLCCRIADESKTIVLSVIYRHTHQYKHPAQVDDAWEAFEYIRDHTDCVELSLPKELAVMGISAGCTLAASVILRDIELSRTQPGYAPRITGAVLGIPWLIHIDNYPFHLFKSREVSAKIQNKETPVVPYERLKLFSDLLGAEYVSDRLLNTPLLPDDELKGWPRTVFLVAGADPLRDDGLIFAKKLESLSVPTKVHVYPGLPHGFRRWSQLAATKSFDATSIESIAWALARGESCSGSTGQWKIYGRT